MTAAILALLLCVAVLLVVVGLCRVAASGSRLEEADAEALREREDAAETELRRIAEHLKNTTGGGRNG